MVNNREKSLFMGFCEYQGRKPVQGKTVWSMVVSHFIDGHPLHEVAYNHGLHTTHAWSVLTWIKKKFQRHGLWTREMGLPVK